MAIMPWRMESAPSDGPTVRSSRICTGAGRAPGPQHDGQVARLLHRELAR